MPSQQIVDLHADFSIILGSTPGSWRLSENRKKHTSSTWDVDIPWVIYSGDESDCSIRTGQRCFVQAIVDLDYDRDGRPFVDIYLPLAELRDMLSIYAVIGYCASEKIPFAVHNPE